MKKLFTTKSFLIGFIIGVISLAATFTVSTFGNNFPEYAIYPTSLLMLPEVPFIYGGGLIGIGSFAYSPVTDCGVRVDGSIVNCLAVHTFHEIFYENLQVLLAPFVYGFIFLAIGYLVKSLKNKKISGM